MRVMLPANRGVAPPPTTARRLDLPRVEGGGGRNIRYPRNVAPLPARARRLPRLAGGYTRGMRRPTGGAAANNAGKSSTQADIHRVNYRRPAQPETGSAAHMCIVYTDRVSDSYYEGRPG